MSSNKERQFRGIEWFCEDGHRNVYSTSFYRLSKIRLSLLIGEMLRGGEWCQECNCKTMPSEFGDVVNL